MSRTGYCRSCGLFYGRFRGLCRKCFEISGLLTPAEIARRRRVQAEKTAVLRLEHTERRELDTLLLAVQGPAEDVRPRESRFVMIDGVEYEVMWDGT